MIAEFINDKERPCLKCGKTLRYDFNGFCMDCADELGISEFFYKKKEYKDNLIKAIKKYMPTKKQFKLMENLQ